MHLHRKSRSKLLSIQDRCEKQGNNHLGECAKSHIHVLRLISVLKRLWKFIKLFALDPDRTTAHELV